MTKNDWVLSAYTRYQIISFIFMCGLFGTPCRIIDVSKHVGGYYATVSKIINELVFLGLVVKEKRGRNTYLIAVRNVGMGELLQLYFSAYVVLQPSLVVGDARQV